MIIIIALVIVIINIIMTIIIIIIIIMIIIIIIIIIVVETVLIISIMMIILTIIIIIKFYNSIFSLNLRTFLMKTFYRSFLLNLSFSSTFYREIFMILRDNFLFENWTRLKLEKLTNLCNKRIFETGEYLFRQVSVRTYIVIYRFI